MSLFDVIRYPISNPPTKEELWALPPDLFNEWKKSVGWKNVRGVTPGYVEAYYKEFNSDEAYKLDNIRLLRKMIKDYDNI